MTKWSKVLRRMTVRNIKDAVWRRRMDRACQKRKEKLGCVVCGQLKKRQGEVRVCVGVGARARGCECGLPKRMEKLGCVGRLKKRQGVGVGV